MNWYRSNRRNLKKLNYTPLQIEDVTFYVARSTTQSMHITVKSDMKAYAVCNYVAKQSEFEEFLREHLDWARKAIEEQKKDYEKIRSTPITDDEKEKLHKKLDIFVKRYEILMETKVNKWNIRKLKAIWGDCHKENREITFSLQLARCNDNFIEYVVVHEMAHLFEFNHSRKFWNIVEKYIPDYKIRKKEFTC